ncbi:hypothetical protein Y710_04515 [Gordonia sp. QH-12]|uniref:LuxR C-terminal-related transcriptional regulator n=2 Tax=Gordoniaceae TaxID=85026 RepID=A0ABN3HKG6_9ACTN|nr:hypothetical protein Y710_04515 [Gordonia sp. QH-12]
MLELVDRMPDSVRIVAVTRHDPPWPLHRMRVESVLSEVRVDEIRFGVHEAAALLADASVTVGPDDVERLVERTGGWAAGLRLAAIGLASAADPHAYATEFSGRDGYVADYLMREVFLGAPLQWRYFLTRVCVADEVCPELAAALGGGEDSGERLAELAGLNMFVHESANAPGWYRLHPLLLDLLRSRITDRRDLATSHRVAAHWFREQGMPRRALEHAIEANEWEAASELVGTHIIAWAMARPPDWLSATLSRVPRDAVLTHPGLAIGVATAEAMTGRTADLDELAAAAHGRVCRLEGRRRRRYEFLLELVELGLRPWIDDPAGLRARCDRLHRNPEALATSGLADWDVIRTALVGNLGACELWSGDRVAGRADLADVLRYEGGPRILLPVLNARANLALLEWQDGDLSAAETHARRAVADADELGSPLAVQAGAAHLAPAGIALDRDDLDDAATWLDSASASVHSPHATVVLVVLQARLMMARRAVAEALRFADEALRAASVPGVPDSLVTVAIGTHAVLSRNRHRRRVGIRFAGDADSIRGMVAECLDVAANSGGGSSRDQRLRALDRALGIAAGHRLRRSFLERGVHLRELLSDRVAGGTEHSGFALDLLNRIPVRTGGLVDEAGRLVPRLSAREMDVLRHLLGATTTAEIADRLFISVNTVKTHQRAIYQKLGARPS